MEDIITDYIIDVEQDTTNHVIKSAKYYKRALLQRNITDTHYISMEDTALREEMLSLRDASKGFAGTPAYKYHMVNTVLSEYAKRCSSREFYVELFLLREDYLKYREHAVLGINYDEVRSEFYEQKGNMLYIDFSNEDIEGNHRIREFEVPLTDNEHIEWERYRKPNLAVYPATFHIPEFTTKQFYLSSKDRFANHLYAFTVDIDNVSAEDLIMYLKNGWAKSTKKKNGKRICLPKPTYIVNSGNGIHLYYELSTPIKWRMHNQNLARLLSEVMQRVYGTITDSDSNDEALANKTQGKLRVIQPMRMVGSYTKHGEIVTAYRYSEKWEPNSLLKAFGLDNLSFWDETHVFEDYCYTNSRIKKTRAFINYLTVDIPVQSNNISEFIHNMRFYSKMCRSAGYSEVTYYKHRDKTIKYFIGLHDEYNDYDFSKHYALWKEVFQNAELGIRYEWNDKTDGLLFVPREKTGNEHQSSYYTMLMECEKTVKYGHRFWTLVACAAKAKRCNIPYDEHLKNMEKLFASMCATSVRNNMNDNNPHWETFTIEDYKSALKLGKTFYYSDKYVRNDTLNTYVGNVVAGTKESKPRKKPEIPQKVWHEANVRYVIALMEQFIQDYQHFPKVHELAGYDYNAEVVFGKAVVSGGKDKAFFYRYYDDAVSWFISHYDISRDRPISDITLPDGSIIKFDMTGLIDKPIKTKSTAVTNAENITALSRQGKSVGEIIEATGLCKTTVYNHLNIGSKKDVVFEWLDNHDYVSVKDIVNDTGISKPTVIKYKREYETQHNIVDTERSK